MDSALKTWFFSKKSQANILIFFIIADILLLGMPFFESTAQEAVANLTRKFLAFTEEISSSKLLTLQDNTLIPVSIPSNPESPMVKKIKVVLTAYSSTPWETDESPYLTAAGTWVRDGVVANNLLSFGTKIKIPELYGEKVFVVEDRMNTRSGYYHVDIWFPSHGEAKSFGAKRTYIEVLEG